MDDLISIVIPIYNVEKYICQCLNSVINQSYTNLEIIIVDDGTKDNSGIICDEYASKDRRIKVIHKENGGLSDARNVGIDNANGKYITFVDSDDYIKNNYIEELYKAIIDNKVKVSQCSINKVNDNNEILNIFGYENNIILSGRNIIKDINNNHWTENTVVWNKIYLKELFNEIRYPVGKINEDEFITYKILYNLDKVAIIKNELYNYRKNVESITEKKFSLKRLNALEALEERLQFFKEKADNELYNLTLELYFKIVSYMYINVSLYYKDNIELQNELFEKYKKCYKIVNKKVINNEKRLLFYLPKIYLKLYEIKNNVKV